MTLPLWFLSGAVFYVIVCLVCRFIPKVWNEVHIFFDGFKRKKAILIFGMIVSSILGLVSVLILSLALILIFLMLFFSWLFENE